MNEEQLAHDAGLIPDVDASDMSTNELSALLLEQLAAARLEVAELSPEDIAAGAPIEEPCIDCPFKVGGINTTPENATELVKLATSTDPHPCHRTVLGPLLLPCRGARQFCENIAETGSHDGVYKTIEEFTAAKTLGTEAPK